MPNNISIGKDCFQNKSKFITEDKTHEHYNLLIKTKLNYLHKIINSKENYLQKIIKRPASFSLVR